MDEAFQHLPVMAAEVTDLLGAVPTGLVVDATVGGGGEVTGSSREGLLRC